MEQPLFKKSQAEEEQRSQMGVMWRCCSGGKPELRPVEVRGAGGVGAAGREGRRAGGVGAAASGGTPATGRTRMEEFGGRRRRRFVAAAANG